MEPTAPKSFYLIQEAERARTRGLFLVLLVIYVLGIGAAFVALDLAVGLAFVRPRMLTASAWLLSGRGC